MSNLTYQRPHSNHPNPVCQDTPANHTAQMVPTSLPPFLYLLLSLILFTKILHRPRPRHHGRVTEVDHEKEHSDGSLLPILVSKSLCSPQLHTVPSLFCEFWAPEDKILLCYLLACLSFTWATVTPDETSGWPALTTPIGSELRHVAQLVHPELTFIYLFKENAFY